jgi:glycosyltransferase involved in cell wall biosynthesis
MAAPRVSIVIPTYNSERHFAATLDSILGQTMPDLELVLLDDGSTDRTLEISADYAKRDARVRVVPGAHEGIAGARNRGLKATNPGSEFVTFFDHDDVWEPNALELLVGALEKNPRCVAAHGVARCIDTAGNVWPGDDHPENSRARLTVRNNRVVPLELSEPTSFETELIKNYITTPGTSLVRRPVMESVGGFEASTVPCDDWDMNLRICRRGDFAFVNEILLNWRRHEGAASQSSKRWRQAFITSRLRSIHSTENTPSQREAALCAFRYYCTDLCAEAGQDVRAGMLQQAGRKLLRSLYLYPVYLRASVNVQEQRRIERFT